MTWLNPLALLGLLAVAVPIIVHLFGRRIARRQRFSSLRLLPRSFATPTTRTQPSDLLLLVLRCAIVVVAALALAQPLLLTSTRTSRSEDPARVVVLDTSASMRRRTSSGEPVLAQARERAVAMLDSARSGTMIETGRPGRNLEAASEWLGTQSGKREIVVISDFQIGALNDGDLDGVNTGIGLRMVKIGALTASRGPAASTAPVTVAPEADGNTGIYWSVRPDTGQLPLTLLSSDSVAARIAAAVVRRLVPAAEPNHAVAVAFPDHAETESLLPLIEPMHEPWQGDLLLALRRDPLLDDVSIQPADRSCLHPGAVPVPNDRGHSIATVAGTRRGGRFELLVFSCAGAGSVAGTSLLAAVVAANARRTQYAESDPMSIPDSVLQHWERPATERAPPGRNETSPDGRWFWLLALALLGIEEWLRRGPSRRPNMTAFPDRHERVA